ncbi:FAD-dependent oxidoreductase [Hoeflea sp. TYP-13]|uniref:FAD-dependent oxidoreductase n=1 Tax=Hoeflea sp. TYP-13 TaxID=3230023 RepID=UPI0034C6D006
MHKELPQSAKVVIVGGGIVGCSVAYHLARSGWSDILLLERDRLTCGSTWHAAGLVSEMQAVPAMTELARYGLDLMERLEADTGQATGFKRNGSIAMALNAGRMEELRRKRDSALGQNIEVHELSPEELKSHWPMLNITGAVGAIHFPNDGQTNPIDTTMALAKAARNHGATIREGITVRRVTLSGGRATGVETDQGTIAAEFVVNCTGIWAHSFAGSHGIKLPIQANQHFYVVTDPVEGLTPDLPVLRVYDEGAYYKEDAGKLLIGFSEPNAKVWNPEGGIPGDFSFDELPFPDGHLDPLLELLLERVPAIQNVGIRTFFNGPEGYTPDGKYVLGSVAGCSNYFVAGGFNSTGIQSGPGAGKALADWIIQGCAPMDLADVDVNRFGDFQSNHSYLVERVPETLTLFYQMHWPYKQRALGRNLRRSPFHHHWAENGAVFGEGAGWERPMWFAPDGVEPEYQYAFGRAPFVEHWEREHKALREDLGLIDLSPFAKFQVEGPDALTTLQFISTNDIDCPVGNVVYTQWLNEKAGIEADLTIARLAEDRFLIMTSAGTAHRDLHWLKAHVQSGAHVTITDITAAQAVIGLMGPRARDFLQVFTKTDLSNEAFPFGTFQEVEIGRVGVRAQRITYQGELGWEIFVSSEFAGALLEDLLSGQKAPPPALVGFHAAESLRVEKAFRHWGHDMASFDTPVEAGLMFAAKLDKPGGFIGRDALVSRRETGGDRRIMQFLLEDPDAFIYHHEPIYRDGEVVGSVTTGSYGHSLGGAVALGMVSIPKGGTAKDLTTGSYEIAVAGKRIAARASLRPMFDPANARVKA